jgi:hypothetical protein
MKRGKHPGSLLRSDTWGLAPTPRLSRELALSLAKEAIGQPSASLRSGRQMDNPPLRSGDAGCVIFEKARVRMR